MPNTYRLVHRPEHDATGCAIALDGEVTQIDRVGFAIDDPADEHEAAVRLTMSRPAWESQGSPEELLLALSAPIREGVDGA
jgi:hypothetical protein